MTPGEGGIAQVAFVVRDLDASVELFARDLDVGPWMVVRNLAPADARVHGEPVQLDVSVAIAYAGSVMIELIEEHGDVRLPRKDTSDTSDCAFHHVARTSAGFADDYGRMSHQGRAVVYEASLPAELGGGRFAYFDNPGPLPGYLELVELTPQLAALFASVRSAAEQWDRQTAVI
jgi:glyoxalase/bleomycin resistance protein/dioxygenase superfamily protein